MTSFAPPLLKHHPQRLNFASPLLCAGAAFLFLSVPPSRSEDFGIEGYRDQFLPLLETHCITCHGGEKVKGDVDFTKLTSRSAILGQDDLWRRVREAIEFEDMPPRPGKTGFTPDHAEEMIAYVESTLESADLTAEEFRHPGPSFIRQLTPYEYKRTVKDLLYLEDIPFERVGVKQDYPHEGHHFVNQALGMALSTDEFDRYLRASDEALKLLFADETGVWNEISPDASEKYKAAAARARADVIFVQPGNGVSHLEAATQVIQRFASRALRRPVSRQGTEQFIKVFQKSGHSGANYEQALRHAMTAVLASPYFMLRVERNQAPEGSDEIYPVQPFELATRLSYFLWSTTPDVALLTAAANGELMEEGGLEAQIDRMLAHEKAKSLTEHFAYQWMQMKFMNLPSIPDGRGFPELTPAVETAFAAEMKTFFDRLRTEDRPILDLLESDYTYANRELAEFYGIDDPAVEQLEPWDEGQPTELVEVALKPEDHRGGLLGMGGFLWMTSHETRTKPTQRGLWVLEVVLGTPPPPPPPEAGSFAPPAEGQPEPKNFREKLQQHASDENCSGCHAKIDPLGFALENFDAIGAWRTEENGDPVDNGGELPTGESFVGFQELRDVIVARKDQFTRNFVKQLLTYALGRELLPTDRGTVELIARQVEENDYRFSEVIRGIVTSRAFQYRVNLDSAMEISSNNTQ